MNGHFEVIKVTDLKTSKVGDTLPESDFYEIDNTTGTMVQFSFIEEDQSKKSAYSVHPGVYSIVPFMGSLRLEKAELAQNDLLESLVSTADIINNADKFFNAIPRYKEMGIVLPKRGILLYGPPGCGKSSAISKIVKKYQSDDKTLIVLWSTDKVDPRDAKHFINSFSYQGVDKLILIAEDIGGVEIEQQRIPSLSSLLSLLDNNEMTFKIPTLIIGTTNYPEVFMENITNRPQRFDVKIEVGYPNAEARASLLEFFMKEKGVTPEQKAAIQKKECSQFSIAHIYEAAIRSYIFEMPLQEAIEEIRKEIELVKKAFDKSKKSVGFGSGGWD